MALKPSGRKRPGPPTLKALKDRKTMSKIDLSAAIKSRAGEAVKREDGRTQTVGLLLLDVVDVMLPADTERAEGKMKLVRIGNKIDEALEVGEVDLSKADCTLLLERAAKCANALVYGQLVKALDPDQLKADA